ncbi:hypothetical protein KUL156_04070 [Alteromonas sp. KUL156]|nr:hypothetical protein KUL154_06100 [Alteromonas sp. KUL154]GFD97814.1 hypothetical protein KUL156_04070 [Alteromonas sp. KUL156]
MFFSFATQSSRFSGNAALFIFSVVVFVGFTVFTSSSAQASSFSPANPSVNEGIGRHGVEQSHSAIFKRSDKINVAVAANFAKPLKSIAEQFTELTGIDVAVTVSSSGTLYAQIQHGASFDVFLSADRARPQALVDNNLVHESNIVDYAKGKLVFIHAGDLPYEESCKQGKEPFTADAKSQLSAKLIECLSMQLSKLMENPQSKIAIANPKLAPYGIAAQQTLQNLGLSQRVVPHSVMGKNVLQTLQFYTTGSVKGAFVANSLALDLPSNLPFDVARADSTKSADATTVIIPVSDTLYRPIIQSLVVNSKTAARFSPNLFDPTVLVEEAMDEDERTASKPFNLSRADGVPSASLFVQYVLSQSVQHSLNEWGYESVNLFGAGQ